MSSSTTYHLFMQDFSKSTSGNDNYHIKAKELYYELFKKSVPQGSETIKLGIWNDDCHEATEDILQHTWENRVGRGDHYPHRVSKWIKSTLPSDAIINLFIITDGDIPIAYIDEAREANTGINYSSIKFHIISNKKPTDIDPMVGFGFSESTVQVFINGKEVTITSSLSFDYDSVTPDNFESKAGDLHSHIWQTALLRPRQVMAEVRQLTKLRDKLMANKSPPIHHPIFTSTKKEDIINVLEELPFFQNMNSKSFNTIYLFFNGLFRTIHDRKQCMTFKQIKKRCRKDIFNLQAEDGLDAWASQPSYRYASCSQQGIVDFHRTGSDIEMLLLRINSLNQSVRHKSFGQFQRLVACPLYGKSYVDDSLDHICTIDEYNNLPTSSKDANQKLSHKTRRPVFGGIILDDNADCWNDYVISRTFFDGQKVGDSYALWYFMLYVSCRDKDWISSEHRDRIKKYAYRRISQDKIPLSFTRSKTDPKEMVSIPYTLRYCTDISTAMFAEENDLWKMEKLRQYADVAPLMLEILKDFGHEVDFEFLERRVQVLKMVNTLKRIHRRQDKVRHVLGLILEEEKGGFLTTKIKDMSMIKYLDMIDKDLHTKPIPLDYDGDSCSKLSDFVLTSYEDKEDITPSLNEKTWRPKFVNQQDGKNVSFYKQQLDNTLEPKFRDDNSIVMESPNKINFSKVLSLYQMYIEYVTEHKKHPKFESFKSYVQKKKEFVFVDGKILIRLFPPKIVTEILQVHEVYQQSRRDPIDVFIKKTRRSKHIEYRIGQEDVTLPSSIPTFIEEAKRLLD